MERGYWELSKAGYWATRWLMLARELGSWPQSAWRSSRCHAVADDRPAGGRPVRPTLG
jgi:hypothetical protein